MMITLAGERPKSLNQYWAGMHWTKRKKEADRVHQLVLRSVPHDAVMFNSPVFIVIHAYFKNRPFDADNIVAKPYIDALKGRLLREDDKRFVRGVMLYPYVDKENPRLEIEIVKAA